MRGFPVFAQSASFATHLSIRVPSDSLSLSPLRNETPDAILHRNSTVRQFFFSFSFNAFTPEREIRHWREKREDGQAIVFGTLARYSRAPSVKHLNASGSLRNRSVSSIYTSS